MLGPKGILAPESLAVRCDPASLETVPTPQSHPIGQDRAVEALRFAISIKKDGYNVQVAGPPGAGKHGLTRTMLEEVARSEPTPPDWCYVHDFDRPRAPKALSLPPGRGRDLSRDLKQLVEDLLAAIPAAFEADAFRSRLRELEEQVEARQRNVFRSIRTRAAEQGVALVEMPNGVVFAPVENGEVVSPDKFEKLDDNRKKEIEQAIGTLEEELKTELRKLPHWAKEVRERVRALERETTQNAVDATMEALRVRWKDLPEVVTYLDRVERDVIENAIEFRKKEEDRSERNGLDRYAVNVIVDRTGAKGAPVIYEDWPRVDRLVGRIEQRAHLGNLVSDLSSIKAGALHAANGGYLVLDLHRLLQEPLAWSVLKRSLFAHEVRIEPVSSLIGLPASSGLEPSPIPLRVQVMLLGDRRLQFLLASVDSETADLFKVLADFEDEVERTPESIAGITKILGGMALKAGGPELEASAQARLVDECSREADDQYKLSTNLRFLTDLVEEATHRARSRNAAKVAREDVEDTLRAVRRRKDRIREQSLRMILDDTLVVPTSGARVGEINGLSVMSAAGSRFGRPSRISATARLGSRGVVDIEREVELGGPIHSKGVLILTNFFAARYGRSIPLSFTASLVFEQSYGGVEGDSASLAELCALVSALSDVPIRQCFAVTGSVDQHGRVQAIGGVNEKIEGFFEVCRARGLTGEHAVMIPTANVRNLMLHDEVIDACRPENGSGVRFRVIAVETVDEALTWLTGLDAGAPDEKGGYPPGTLNALVLSRLEEMARSALAFLDKAEESKKDGAARLRS